VSALLQLTDGSIGYIEYGYATNGRSGTGQNGDAREGVSAHAADATSNVFELNMDALYHGPFRAVRDIRLALEKKTITAFIGPSGCGKSTVLRCLNRMNDVISGFRFEGEVLYRGRNIYDRKIDPVAVRRTIGMVFQKPNPFAMSIFRNVAYGLKLNRYRGNFEEKVEQALRGAALWDEVKDKLHQSALALSGGQQQRLRIARAIATEPDVLLMDEPCSAIDPVGTRKIEELMHDLKRRFTIAIVTHNLQQAKRVSDKTAFFYVDVVEGGRTGYLVEFGDTRQIFEEPKREHTKGYIRGEFS
jgi:phosphate transport system ATP-binding protein